MRYAIPVCYLIGLASVTLMSVTTPTVTLSVEHFLTIGRRIAAYAGWILFVTLIPGAAAVTCTRCWEDGHGRAACPLITGIASNVAAVAAGAYTSIALAKLLPPYLLRLFPGTVLQTIVTLAKRTNLGAFFDFTGKTHGEILRAVRSGVATRDEAVDHVSADLDSAEEKTVEKAHMTIKTLASLPESSVKPHASAPTQGVYRFIFARISYYVTSGTCAAFFLSGVAAVQEATTAPGSHSARLHHPKTATEFFEMLNLWIWVMHAAGVVDVLVLTAFLQDVVYVPMRREGYSWMIAYGLFHVYLAAVEEQPERMLRLDTVYHVMGGMDSKVQAAKTLAAECFGSLFETGGQHARDLRNTSADGRRIVGSTTSQPLSPLSP